MHDRGGRSHTTVHVRFAPKADKRADVSLCPLSAISGCEQSQQGRPLFDHLVGTAEQHRWDGKAERLGGLEINDEIELGGLLHGKIGGLCPAQDLVDIIASVLLIERRP
jgi:hypothetical protein